MQGNKINIGENLEDKLLDSNSNTIKWIQVDNEKDLKQGMKEQKYFGAAVIENDFSKNALSKTQKIVMDAKKEEMKDKVQSGEIPAAQAKKMQEKMSQSDENQQITPQKASFKTFINDGAGTQVSQMSSQVLKGMGDNMNQQITKQSLDILEKQDRKSTRLNSSHVSISYA